MFYREYGSYGYSYRCSITVAPAMTLSDTCYQKMRNQAIKMMRSIGDFAGGCNVQLLLVLMIKKK